MLCTVAYNSDLGVNVQVNGQLVDCPRPECSHNHDLLDGNVFFCFEQVATIASILGTFLSLYNSQVWVWAFEFLKQPSVFLCTIHVCKEFFCSGNLEMISLYGLIEITYVKKDPLAFSMITSECTHSVGLLINLVIPIFVILLSSDFSLSHSAKGIFLGWLITGGTEESTVMWYVFWRVLSTPKQSWYLLRRATRFTSIWKICLIKLSFLLVVTFRTGWESISAMMNMIGVTTFLKFTDALHLPRTGMFVLL